MIPALQLMEIDGHRIAWREAGSGMPLVLVHGIGGHSGSWENQFVSFAPDYRVIAWDAPGYGKSEALADDALTVEGYASSLAGLLRALDAEHSHLIGHSLGAVIISAASQQGATQPRSLTLLQPVTGTGKLPFDERERIRLARIADMKRLGPVRFAVERGAQILSRLTPADRAEQAVAVMKLVPESGYLAAWEMMCRADIFSVLNKKCRTQVICCADDPVSPPATGQEIAAQIPDAQFHSVANIGHYASIEAPELLDDLIRRFIVSE